MPTPEISELPVGSDALVRHWRFPMGDKTVDIYIHGDGELTEEDDECFRDFLDASHRTFNVRLYDDDPRNPNYKGACGGTMAHESVPNDALTRPVQPGSGHPEI